MPAEAFAADPASNFYVHLYPIHREQFPDRTPGSITVTGKVTVNGSGEPLPGVTVLLKGTTIGTATNSEGSYSLTLPDANGVVISLFVQLNYELEREILGFGDQIKVLGPEKLKRGIKEALCDALDQYNYDTHNANLSSQLKKLQYRGFSILQHVFTRKEMNHVKTLLARYQDQTGKAPDKPVYAIRNVLGVIPGLGNVILNQNLKRILAAIHPELFLTKALYFDKPPASNWYVTWHQDTTISVKEKIQTEGFFGWTRKEGIVGVCPPEEFLKNTVTVRIHLDDTDEKNGALQIIPGSQNKWLSPEEIALITQNTLPFTCEVGCGGIHLMKPLLLHSSAKTVNQKHRRVIHLEFNSMDLPNGLEWAEKMEL